MNRTQIALALWCAAGVPVALAQQASAPAPAAALDQIQEVTVTATRRSESLQDVPLSITALSADTLEKRAVRSFIDYAGQVPSLAYGATGDGSATSRTISIRGVSGDNTTGFYIDETPVPDSIDPRVLDVQRIEVLRGPQGTLYGARSMGGTVRLITVQPNLDQMEGRVSVNGGKTQNTDSLNYGLDGAISIPLIKDTMALRLAGFYQHDAGYFQRRFLSNPADAANLPPNANPLTVGALPTTTANDVNRVNSYGAAASLLIKASDAFSITPRVMFQKADANGFPYADDGSYPVPVPAVLPPVNMHPHSLLQARFYNLPESSKDSWVLASLGLNYDAGPVNLLSSTAYFDRTVDETEDETDFLWQNLEAPFDGLPLSNAPNAPLYHAVPLASTIRELKQIHRFVQELRVTSKTSGPVQYVAGFFFSDTRGRVPFAGYYPPALAPGISQTAGFTFIGIPVNPNNPDEIFGQDYQTKQTEPALYGEVSWAFAERWKLTGGLRAYDVKTQTGGYLEGIAFGGARITDPQASNSERGINPKIGLDWKVQPDKLLYVDAARGFRPGGLVPSIPGNSQIDPLGCFAQLTALGYTSAAQTKSFASDHLWTGEVGWKTAWVDNRLTVNGAVYYTKWDSIQQLVALPCGFQFRANSGQAKIKGFDLEVHARPVSGLDLSAGVGLQHARISQGSPLVPSLQEGNRVYEVPDWTANAAASYTIPLVNGNSLNATASWTYTGDSVSASVDANNPRIRPSYSLVDLRLGYMIRDYEVALVGKNLTNTLANLGDNRSLAAETLGRPRIVVNAPRTIGVELRAKF
ncbi:MAG: TonB-dependent receptor [Proteobacteria bacterium]|nr:TonB-dependent receptor [Pseudomonadota bacterium]